MIRKIESVQPVRGTNPVRKIAHDIFDFEILYQSKLNKKQKSNKNSVPSDTQKNSSTTNHSDDHIDFKA